MEGQGGGEAQGVADPKRSMLWSPEVSKKIIEICDHNIDPDFVLPLTGMNKIA
jgi:hypothetical protein